MSDAQKKLYHRYTSANLLFYGYLLEFSVPEFSRFIRKVLPFLFVQIFVVPAFAPLRKQNFVLISDKVRNAPTVLQKVG